LTNTQAASLRGTNELTQEQNLQPLEEGGADGKGKITQGVQ
jgi:hypothetical protein